MDQKHDSRKQPLCQLDDGSLSCPDCEDLTEHRSKHCSKQIFTQTTVSSNTMDADTDKDDTEKRQCYRCDNCHLSFTDSQNLKDHLKENCLKIPVVDLNQAKSYESCMNTLTSVMYNEECYFGSLKKARRQTSNAIKRYSLVKKRKDYAHKAYTEAVDRERTLCTIVSAEEQQILSHLTAQYHQTLNAAMKELEIAGQAVNNALRQLKHHKLIAMFASTKVDFAYSDVIKAFGELRFDTNLSPEDRDQEHKKIEDVLKQRHRIYTELQDGMRELETSASIILGIEIGMDATPTASGSEISMDAAINSMKETVDVAKPNQMDVTLENLDDPKSSTSGAYLK